MDENGGNDVKQNKQEGERQILHGLKKPCGIQRNKTKGRKKTVTNPRNLTIELRLLEGVEERVRLRSGHNEQWWDISGAMVVSMVQ